MQPVIQIDDKHAFAFGLSWQTLDSMMSRSSQIRDMRQNSEARWIASFKVNGQENIGYAKSLVLPPNVVTLSAAGQVALSRACHGKTVLILLEEQGEAGQFNDVGVIGLINGNVIHDAFVKTNEVDEICRRFSEQCARAGAEFITMGKTITLAPVQTSIEWSDLLPPPPGKGIARFKSRGTVPVVALKADIPSWVMFSAIGTLVAGAGLWYWQEVSSENDRLRLLNTQKAPDPAQLYADSIAKVLAEPVLPAKAAFAELREQLRAEKFPMHLGGWKLERIICGVPGCSASWTREQGTFAEFVERAPQSWGEVQLDPEGTRVLHNVPIKLTKAALQPVAEWLTEREFRLADYSKWQKYASAKFGASARPAALIGVPPSVQPNQAATFPNAVWALDWEVREAEWWMSETLDTMPAGATVETITLSFGGSVIKFEAKGKVYVRKN